MMVVERENGLKTLRLISACLEFNILLDGTENEFDVATNIAVVVS